MILVRLNGSVTPLRLTTARTASSTVVNRLPHSGQDRRRRISCAVVGLPGVDHAGVGVPAVRTTHAMLLPVLTSDMS